MSLSTLAVMGKIQKNVCAKVRPVDLTNKKTQSKTNTPPFMKVVYTSNIRLVALLLAQLSLRSKHHASKHTFSYHVVLAIRTSPCVKLLQNYGEAIHISFLRPS